MAESIRDRQDGVLNVIKNESEVTIAALAEALGTSPQRVSNLLARGDRLDSLCELLCRLRIFYGGGWNRFGKLLDELYTDE